MNPTARARLKTALIAGGVALYLLPPYLYARFAQNYHHNTAIHYVRWGFVNDLIQSTTNNYYPPLYFWYRNLIVNVLDFSYPAAAVASVPFVLLAAFYLGKLGTLLLNRRAGFAAAGVFLFLPGTVMVLSTTVRDAPLALFAVGTIYHLVRSNGLRRPGQALAAGVLAGLGLLTKWTFPVYIAGFLPLVLAAMIRPAAVPAGVTKHDNAPGSPWRGTLLFSAAVLAVAGWWYLGIHDFSLLAATAKNDATLPVYTYPGMIKTTAIYLFIWQVRQFAWFPLALGALVALAWPKARALGVTLVVTVAAGMLLLSVPYHTEARYFYPLLPWIALLVACPLAAFRRSALRIAYGALLIVLIGAGYLDTVLGDRFFPRHDAQFNLVNDCDKYQVDGRMIWQRNRGSRPLARLIQNHHALSGSDRRAMVVINAYSPRTCQLEPHPLRISGAAQAADPVVEFHLFQPWLAEKMAQGGPYYFPVRERIEDGLEKLNAPAPPFVNIHSGQLERFSSFAEKMALRDAVRTHLEKIGQVDLPAVGPVGVYFAPDGAQLLRWDEAQRFFPPEKPPAQQTPQ